MSVALLSQWALLLVASPPPPIRLLTDWQSSLGPNEVIAAPSTGIRLSWQLQLSNQTSYEAEIWMQELLWSSGVVNSSQQQVIASPYPELRAAASHTWRVRVSDGSGFSDWSSRSSFDTAPSPLSWEQESAWIGGPNFSELRTERNIPANISRARAYVTAAGAFTLHINGQRVGNNICDPGQTVYDMRLLYNTFDILPFVRNGANVFSAMLGNYKFGYMDVWCNISDAAIATVAPTGATNAALLAEGGPNQCRAFLMQVVVELTNGEVIKIGTDDTWEGRLGAIVRDHMYHGERYLQGLESASAWAPVQLMYPRVGELQPVIFPSVRITESFSAKNVTAPMHPPGTIVCEKEGLLGGKVPEGQFVLSQLNLTCRPGTGRISKVLFASFGTPTGDSCSTFAIDEHCHAPSSLAVVEKLCLGKESCAIAANTGTFNHTDPCPDVLKALAAVVQGCDAAPVPPSPQQSDTVLTVDFGQNMAGFSSLELAGPVPAGAVISMRHNEIVSEDGSVSKALQARCIPDYSSGDHQCNCGPYGGNCANQTNEVVIGPSGVQADEIFSYTPTFMYAGFRYVELTITNWPGMNASMGMQLLKSKMNLTAHFAHSDVHKVGAVELGKVDGSSLSTPDILNRIQQIIVNAQRSQLWSIPTDCPQRERRGWMGDAHMSSDEAMYNFDTRTFHASFLQSIRDDQIKGCANNAYNPCSPADRDKNRGSLPDVVPFTTGPYGGFPGSLVWQAAYPVIVRNLWKHYADQDAVATHFEGLCDLVQYWQRHADPDGLVTFGNLGDWVNVGWPVHNTPTPPVSAFYYLLSLEYMADFAHILDIPESSPLSSKQWQGLHARMQQAYHARFYNSSSGGYSTNTQCANIMALRSGACPASLRAEVFAGLVRNIQEHGNHLTTGIVGATFVFDVLLAGANGEYAPTASARDAVTAETAGDVALAVLLNDTQPSFGWMIHEGATTLWENWQGNRYTQVGSRNHIMFGGGVGTFMYKAIGGLDTASNTTFSGWRHIVVRPLLAAVLAVKHAKTSVQTRFGLAAVSWEYTDNPVTKPFSMNFTIPAGSSAEVHPPKLPLCRETRVHCTVYVHDQATGSYVYEHVFSEDSPSALAVRSGNFTLSIIGIRFLESSLD